jgi:hypothetical protein
MKRAIAVALLILYLNSYTEMHEVLRLPVLLEHYAEHKRLVKDITFFEFLAMHYKTDVSHDNTDNQLPFKDRSHSFTAPAMALPFQRIVLIEFRSFGFVKHASSYTARYIDSKFTDIFQPPRFS